MGYCFCIKSLRMKKIVIAITIVAMVYSLAGAQKPVAGKAMTLFEGKEPQAYSLFNAAAQTKEQEQPYVSSSYTLTLDREVLSTLRNANAGLVRLVLPDPFEVQLDLYRAEVFSEDARIQTSDGQTFLPNANYRFYRGIIHDNPKSLAIVSVFEDQIQIIYSDQYGNTRIQQTEGNQYLLFKDQDILIPKNLGCFADELKENQPVHKPAESGQRVMTGNCVEVYVECDYKSYQDNGSSVPNTEAWVAALWNEVSTLYENESIPVSVSSVLVYTSTDPFAAYNTTSAVLNAFQAHIAGLSYDGRLAHLLSTRTLGGGIAYIDVLCSTTYQVAFSANLTTTIVQFPTYSWNVEVVTHEMGHNMGSPHTHACAWNGNNTQIDDCGNQWAANNGSTPEGAACYNPNAPIIPASGTIMSYCHLIGGVGINFNNGFGPQPGDLIRNRYNNASCNTGTCSPPACTSLTLPAPNATNVDINQDLFWAASDGADGYRLTIGTTPTNGSILNNVDVGQTTTYNPVNPLPFTTTIYVKIVPYNALGDATGCSTQSFTTEANVAPSCTQVTSPSNGATGVAVNTIITWAHSVGNQTGYKISIGTTLNGTDIVNLLNVGNVTSYDHPTDFPYATTIYVKITPYWAGGDINGCASQSFTTVVPVAGDFCTTAINLPCGGSIAGNTGLALPDPGIPFCGTSIDAPGIWYTFVGDGQNVIISTCSQYNFDTKLNVYSGTCSNLVCVAGIDDFCNTGSLLTFSTTNGTTYYVLVQGWNGATGTYTITRSCYSGPLYCASMGNNANVEWIKTVAVGSFSKTTGSSMYSAFLNDTITVSRGGSHTVTLTPMFAQGARNEYYKVWADFNKDGDFADAGEEIYSAGPSTSAVTGTINIPLTATTGNTRLRVAMKYNSAPALCEAFGFGEVEDYTLKVKCNLVTSTSDSGNGSLRNVSLCVDDGDPVLFAPSLNNQTITVTGTQLISDGIWKWMATAGSNITIQAVSVNRIIRIPVGFSAEIQNLNLIGGTAAEGSAIDNLGSLILRDTNVHPAAGSGSIPIRNTGSISIYGNCDIVY